MSFPLIIPARRLSKAALDDLIRETRVNKIKGSKYGDLLYADKITLLEFTRKYLVETADKRDESRLYSLEIDMDMVEATDGNSSACDYLTDFLKMAKAA